MKLDAHNLVYRELNDQIHQAVADGERHLEIARVCGQRYIGCGLVGEDIRIDVEGTPGNDMAMFMDGPEIVVHGNAQDGVANTMNRGRVIIHGHAGDVLGYAMRGGVVLVRDQVGYRAGIHIKAYETNVPVVLIGSRAGDFLGEYMAGGLIIVLGIDLDGKQPCGRYTGTGMHGGSIFLPAGVEKHLIAPNALISEPAEADATLYRQYATVFLQHFPEVMAPDLLDRPFIKVTPKDVRPYAGMYAH